jgi:hypothetical protein
MKSWCLLCCIALFGHVYAQNTDLQDLPDAALVKRFRPPQVDRVRFEPLPPEQRLINEPKVKLLARKDGYEFCSRITGIPIGPSSRPMACAFWNIKRRECTVVTPEVTGFNYVGHEVRHCFEGAFHD